MGIGGVHTAPVNGQCPNGGTPRITSSYAWGFTKAEDDKSIWYGTADNALCANLTSFKGGLAAIGRPFFPAFQTDETACEYDQAAGKDPGDITGDARPPQIYQIQAKNGKIEEHSPPLSVMSQFTGIRAMGAAGGVVFAGALAVAPIGDDTTSGGAVSLLALDGKTGEFLGEQVLDINGDGEADYNNIKNFINIDGELYVGTALINPEPGPITGHVLKWTGTKEDPFHFEVVGSLGEQAAYFAEFEGRLVASTWTTAGSDRSGGLYISPLLRPGGLEPQDAGGWQRVFGMEQFHPDPITRAGLGGCGMGVLGDKLYFGSCIFPAISTIRHMVADNNVPTTMPAFLSWYVLSEPAASVFQFDHLGQPDQTTTLLYGEKEYPVLDTATGVWSMQENLLHQEPRFGSGGFGNRWAPYAGWGVTVQNGRVFFGGFDSTKIAADVLFNPDSHMMETILGHPVPAAELAAAADLILPVPPLGGADVFYFDDPNGPAKPFTQDGLGNQDNWGVRDLWAVGNKTLFLGTNNGFNFPAEGASDPPRRPGWQIYMVKVG